MTELVENILIGIRKWVNSKVPSQIVTGVKSGETVLSLSGTEIQSTISVAIEKKTVGSAQVDHIVLKGIDGAEVASVDASAFVKDGMIDSVAWSQEFGKTNVLVITWNTESGKQSTEIDFARFIDDYVEGDGISVSGSVISIKIDSTPGNVTLSATSTGLKANVDLSGYSVTGHTHTMAEVSGLANAMAGKSDTGHTHQIGEVSGLSDALSGKADSDHTHTIEDVSGLTETLDEFSEVVSSHINEIEDTLETKQNTINDLETIRSGASLGATALQEIPSEYVTETELGTALSGKSDTGHTHAIGDVSGLTEALSGKSNTGHTHQVSDVSGLSNELNGKADANHTHTMEDVSGLSDELSGKADTSHTHAMSDVSGLSDELSGKADTSHTHAMSEVSGLTEALSGKADDDHTHAMSEVSGLTNALSGKSDTGHTHQVSDVSGLSDELSGKADTGHTHTMEDVSGLTDTIASTQETLTEIGFDEDDYNSHALYTEESDNITASGLVTKIGRTVTLQIYNATTINGWENIFYRLPYKPDATFLPVVNSRGLYESNGVHYTVKIVDLDYGTDDEGNKIIYPVLVLNHYIDGSVHLWEYGQNVTFKLDYITQE